MAQALDVKTIEVAISTKTSRYLDPKLPSAVRDIVMSTPQGGAETLEVGCDVGVWLPHGDATQESTANLTFQDGSKREPYKPTGVTVRKQYGYGAEPPTFEQRIVTVTDLVDIMSFGGRRLASINGREFYATSFGLYVSASGANAWISCSSGSPQIYPSTHPRAYELSNAAAPLGVSDIGYAGTTADGECYLVACDEGLYVLLLSQVAGLLACRWTKLPVLNAITCLRVLALAPTSIRIPVGAGLPDRQLNRCVAFVLSAGCLEAVKVDTSSENFLENVVLLPRPVFHANANAADALDLGEVYGIYSSPRDGLFALATSSGIWRVSSQDPMEVGSLVAQAYLPAQVFDVQVAADTSSFFKFGRQVDFVDDGRLLVCQSQGVLDCDGASLTKIGLPIAAATDSAQFFTAIAAIHGDTCLLGTSEGNIISMPCDWSVAELEPANILSQWIPEYLDEVLLLGPPILVTHGEYTIDDSPACGSDLAEQQKAMFKEALKAFFTVFAGQVLAGAAQILQVIAHKLIIDWATDSPAGADFAHRLYGYTGKSFCMIVPSNVYGDDHQLVKIIPRVVEGQSQTANTKEYSVVDLGDPPYNELARYTNALGWSALRYYGYDNVNVKGVAGSYQLIHFKNWSHDRSRTVRVDLVMKRPAKAGRMTTVV